MPGNICQDARTAVTAVSPCWQSHWSGILYSEPTASPSGQGPAEEPVAGPPKYAASHPNRKSKQELLEAFAAAQQLLLGFSWGCEAAD